MPLCPDCRSEAEVQASGPKPPRWLRWVQDLFSNTVMNESFSGQCDDCSRCDQWVER
jgi:hypothetical protein